MEKQIIKALNKDHLKDLIEQEIKLNGNKCNLNFIDVSSITNMTSLFYESKFNGDVSNWNTSNVIDMSYMFAKSQFNGDVSKWDMEKVEKIDYMFEESKIDKLPYWAKYEDKVQRDKAIFEYKKALQEHEDLTNCISNYAITSKKKFKI